MPKISKNGKIMGRPEVTKSQKRKGRPISMSDHEYERATYLSKRSGMSLSQKVRDLFDKENEESSKKEDIE